ncbi:MAG: rhamnosidase, partial [Clostridia bacterium]|nr:rhamnosidase [Clostridia bacterium]
MWITTREFESLKPIYVFHKQLDKKEIEPSAYCNVHTHFIKDFDATTDKSYTISISADDYYKLYVNGKFVCQGPAPAYLSNYK